MGDANSSTWVTFSRQYGAEWLARQPLKVVKAGEGGKEMWGKLNKELLVPFREGH
jgi:hypothetical protein